MKNFDFGDFLLRRQKLNEKFIDDELKRWKNTREIVSYMGYFEEE